MIEVKTQVELDAALEKTDRGRKELVVIVGGKWLSVLDARVRARENSSVVAWGNSSVVARGNSSVEARDNSSVVASKYVAIHKHAGSGARVQGGVLIEIPKIETAAEWCDYWGVEVKKGTATLYKCVREDWVSSQGFE